MRNPPPSPPHTTSPWPTPISTKPITNLSNLETQKPRMPTTTTLKPSNIDHPRPKPITHGQNHPCWSTPILQPSDPRRFRNPLTHVNFATKTINNHQPQINPSTNHNHRSTQNKPILKLIRPKPIEPKTQPNPRTTHNHRRIGKDWRWVGEDWEVVKWWSDEA